MRARAAILMVVALAALTLAPTFEAMPTGIGSAGDGGCSCHGGASGDTTVVVTGLPEVFNASETYAFSITVVNDDLPRSEPDAGRMGGYRILTTEGSVSAVPESNGHVMDGGLTHTAEANTVRTWDFVWTAPADDDATADFTIYGNAVSGGDGPGGDEWNVALISVPGLNAGATAPSAPPLIILMTALLLAVSLIVLGTMWVFYRRSPDTFTIGAFWDYLKPWLTTTDHKEVGVMYFLYGFLFFLVGGMLALLFRIQ